MLSAASNSVSSDCGALRIQSTARRQTIIMAVSAISSTYNHGETLSDQWKKLYNSTDNSGPKAIVTTNVSGTIRPIMSSRFEGSVMPARAAVTTVPNQMATAAKQPNAASKYS